MIRKIILFTLLICTVFPVYAETDKFCFSSTKITEMRNQASQNSDTQRAYDDLLQRMVAKNESGSTSDAGCVTPMDLAQTCRNVWNSLTEACETFISSIITPGPAKTAFNPLQYSNILHKTNFSDINPDVFQKAFNKTLARRRDKNIPSKLQDMGTTFLEQAKEKQIDPFLTTGISMYESTYGTSPNSRNKNNIAGLVGANGYLTFPTVQASIAKQAETIQKWITASTTLSDLAHSGHYCAKRVATKWAADVSSIARVLYKNYNAILQEHQ